MLSQRALLPAIWLSDPRVREVRELARFRMHLIRHKSALKNRIHSTMINLNRPCPVTDLFGSVRELRGPVHEECRESALIPNKWRSRRDERGNVAK
jgi:hypothetical protein